MWIDGSPLTFQKFTNKLFSKSYTYQSHNRVSILNSCNILIRKHVFLRPSQRISPNFDANYRCTLMLLHNLVSPEWIHVQCEDRHVPHVMCAIPNKNQSGSSHDISTDFTYSCSLHLMEHNGSCLFITWDHINLKTTRKAQKIFPTKDTSQLSFITNTVKITPVLLQTHSSTHLFKYNTFLKVYQEQIFNSSSHAKGYLTYLKRKVKITKGRNTFVSVSQMSMSAMMFCDHINTCMGKNKNDHTITCQDNHKLCLFHKNFQNFTTKSFFGFINHTISSKPLSPFLCQENKSNQMYHDDLVNDCGKLSFDEPLLKMILLTGSEIACHNPHQIPCLPGHPKCYDFSELCIFRILPNKHLSPCRNGGHLGNCSEFVCRTMFKCPLHYCVPWEYVCDTKWDCPSGKDEEAFCFEDHCANMYKCTGQKICIHLGVVCNMFVNCPQGDDEQFCDLKQSTCPLECQCVLYTLFCTSATLHHFESLDLFHFISITNSTIPDTLQKSMMKVAFLSLIDLQMNISCEMFQRQRLVKLEISFNNFEIVKCHCFSNNSRIKYVHLVNNKLKYLRTKAFADLSCLQYVNLSHNDLQTVQRNVFVRTPLMQILSLLGNLCLMNIDPKAFEGLLLNILETTDFGLCCLFTEKTKCSAQKTKHISCFLLLPSTPMKISYVFVSIWILASNLLSVTLLLETRGKKNNTAPTVIPMSICVNGTLCGIYLGILWVADVVFKGDFVSQMGKWKSSIGCHLAAGFSFAFTVGHPSLSMLYSISRWMVVKYPIESKFKVVKFNLKCIGGILFTTMSMTFLILYFSWSTLSASLCSLFVGSADSGVWRIVSTIFVASFHLSVLIKISVSHILLVKEVNESRKIIKQLKKSSQSHSMLYLQLLVLTASNILCWIPTDIVFLVSLFLVSHPPEMVFWTLVVVAPISAVVNPTVFIWQSLRVFRSKGIRSKGKTKSVWAGSVFNNKA